MLPISYFVFKERFGWGAILGTLLAMAGVAALFLVYTALGCCFSKVFEMPISAE